jgi:hypothetical protein
VPVSYYYETLSFLTKVGNMGFGKMDSAIWYSANWDSAIWYRDNFRTCAETLPDGNKASLVTRWLRAKV